MQVVAAAAAFVVASVVAFVAAVAVDDYPEWVLGGAVAGVEWCVGDGAEQRGRVQPLKRKKKKQLHSIKIIHANPYCKLPENTSGFFGVDGLIAR